MLPPVDSFLLNRTGGRWSLTSWATGLPVALVKVRDPKRGRQRGVPLVVVSEGGDLYLVASNFGSRSTPRWYALLTAEGQAQVAWQGRTRRYGVVVLAGEDRQRAWALAARLYPGYEVYAEQAGGRVIPILHLCLIDP
jgi:deazaflavin-dependent oxidoreductase (nitroreductase family)